MTKYNYKRIIKALLDNGYTQKQIAKKVGCNQATISRIKTGDVKNSDRDIEDAIIKLWEAIEL